MARGARGGVDREDRETSCRVGPAEMTATRLDSAAAPSTSARPSSSALVGDPPSVGEAQRRQRAVLAAGS